MFLNNTDFNFFAKIIGGNYVFVVQVLIALTLQATLTCFTGTPINHFPLNLPFL